MATPKNSKRDLEILLNCVELSTDSFGAGASKRIVTAELIWPRMLIASKTASKLLPFAKGKADLAGKSWVKRILFKESVEHTFGIMVRVTETVTATAVRKFLRSMAGSLLGVVGDVAEDSMQNKYLGDLATAPFDYEKKELKSAYTAEIVAEGSIDLSPETIVSGNILEVPLGITKSIYKNVQGNGPHPAPRAKRLITPEGTTVGKATLQINLLD